MLQFFFNEFKIYLLNWRLFEQYADLTHRGSFAKGTYFNEQDLEADFYISFFQRRLG
jgi:hypothetical protein